MEWAEFFNMGGHGFYVWTSWGLSLAVLVTIVIFAKWQNARIRQQIKRQLSREKKLSN